MCPEIPWDAPSRFGASGRVARRVLERALRPALVRQANVNAELRGQLAAQRQDILALQRALGASSGVRSLGELQCRVDTVERRIELAEARSLLVTAKLPAEGERATVVAHSWKSSEARRVLCSNGTGPFASLLEVAAVGLEKYARRHRWDLVVSREDLAGGRPAAWGKLKLVRALLQEYQVVGWIDSDALVVDFEYDIGEVLEEDKDFYLVEQEGGTLRDRVVNSGVFLARATDWTERFFDEVWAQRDLISHRLWENAAIMRLLGYEIDASPIVRGRPTQWLERVKLIDLAWNSIPYWARSSRPRINHYGWLPVPRRRLLMLDDLTQTVVGRYSGDPCAGVHSREDLPFLFNRLGLIGMGAELGVKAGDYSARILHRWAGWRLISIDPWSADDADSDVDIANREQRQSELFVSTTHRLAPFGDRSAIWRMTGREASAHVDDCALDFVYLDARGDRSSISEDLETWEPKVRPGGVIAGRSHQDGELQEGSAVVDGAVHRFFAGRGLEIRETELDRPCSSWWVIQR